ncbi:MAG: hypothetical protein WA154_06910 [Moraxellaceae bacterium]
MMDKNAVRAKFQATGIHLLFSLLLVLVGFALLLMWYPAWLFWSDGGIQVLWLLVGVDLILGPALTFVVYNPKKSLRERVLDLSLIILIQLAAFGYGMYQAYDQRSLVIWYDDTLGLAAPCPAAWYQRAQQPLPSVDPTQINRFRADLSMQERLQQIEMIQQQSAPCVLSSHLQPIRSQNLSVSQPTEAIKSLSSDQQAEIRPEDKVLMFAGRYQQVLLVLDQQYRVSNYYYLPE